MVLVIQDVKLPVEPTLSQKRLDRVRSALACAWPGEEVEPITCNTDLKVWCTSPLEQTSFAPNHSITSAAQLSIAGTRFLARKILPANEPSLDQYLDKMSHNKEFDPETLSRGRSIVQEIFKKGWDKDYHQIAKNVAISASACLERSRKKGGSRGEIGSTYSQDEFIRLCSQGHKFDPRRKVRMVMAKGKTRIVTIASALQHEVKPLHVLIYRHISGQDWVLKGDANARRFKDFTHTEGEFFFSGDYESATDNFPLGLSRAVLGWILETCSHVPPSIQEVALNSLGSVLVHTPGPGQPDVKVRQRCGQLMGNFLSFPLLCVVNYLGFRQTIPRECPVRINGDDIVFRATLSEGEAWREVVGKIGLVMSVGKTLVHARAFCLNSTFFWAKDFWVKYVPIIRALPLFGGPLGDDREVSLSGRWYACSRGFSARQKLSLFRVFFRANSRAIRGSKCSLTRGNNVHVSLGVVRSLPVVFDREVQYLNLPAVVDRPPTVSSGRVPEGYSFQKNPSAGQVARSCQEKVGLMEEFVGCTWGKGRLQVVKNTKAIVVPGPICPIRRRRFMPLEPLLSLRKRMREWQREVVAKHHSDGQWNAFKGGKGVWLREDGREQVFSLTLQRWFDGFRI